MERAHTDIFGPIKKQLLGCARYFVTTLGEYSGYSLVRFLHRKSEAAYAVMEMIRKLENLFNSKIETLRCVKRRVSKSVQSDEGRG